MDRQISRRQLLAGAAGAGLAGAGGAGAGRAGTQDSTGKVPEWTKELGPGVDAEGYGAPSVHEKNVVRRAVSWMNPSSASSVNFTPLADLEGIITPNGLHFERHHAGIPAIEPQHHKLVVHGLVDTPLVFSVDDLKRLPPVSRFTFIECAGNGALEWRGANLDGCQYTHGMISCCEYSGVALRTVLQAAGVKPAAKWLLAEGADAAAMARSIPMEKALDDCIIAYAQNGEALRPGQGYPLRLVVPGYEGNMSVKWLRRLKAGDQPWFTREETARYTDLLANGKARMFTFVQNANSVITRPSPEKAMQGKGYYTISGLAWSGRGKISAVDVSLDGGRNWSEAKLAGPVLARCLTRFHLPLNWQGEELLLQSRAMDETGYVQPSYGVNRAERGSASLYHNNSVHTWLVRRDGRVQNVQI